MPPKTPQEIERALQQLPPAPETYYGMFYEEGVRDTLNWVAGNLADEDFEYAPK